MVTSLLNYLARLKGSWKDSKKDLGCWRVRKTASWMGCSKG